MEHLRPEHDVDLGPRGWEIVADDLRLAGEEMRAIASQNRLKFWASERYPCLHLRKRRWARAVQASFCLDLPAVGDRDVAQLGADERTYKLGYSDVAVLGRAPSNPRGSTPVATFTAAELRSDGDEVRIRVQSALAQMVRSW